MAGNRNDIIETNRCGKSKGEDSIGNKGKTLEWYMHTPEKVLESEDCKIL